ncbi:rho-related GTP-binding protein RhoQ-like [Saccostrea cucullata]|uniref:rho-related GTP-binding protein RhoQ-like n=1 Tax=Saccostrea cuccullata TaxID=36930 RepID=UPI002ED1808F
MVVSMQKSMQCTVVGDGFVGKSCMVQKMASGQFHKEYIATLKDHYKTSISINGDRFDINITDIAGEHEDLSSLKIPDIYIVCFSLVDRDSLDSVEDFWIPKIEALEKNIPVILVGTQMDLRKSMKKGHVKTEEGQKMAKKLGVDYYVECSAKENNGILEIFQKALLAKVRNDKRKLNLIKRMLNR